MKKILSILTLILLFSSIMALGQNNNKPRTKYTNIGFGSQTISTNYNGDVGSKYGVSFTSGRTYYLHQEPVAGILRFGIDATWADLNFASYKVLHRIDGGRPNSSVETTINKADLAVQIGASVAINLVDKLNIRGYFRVAPTYSIMRDNSDLYGGYGTYFVTGASVSYGIIGVGLEYRFGETDFKIYEENFNYGKTKVSGMRLYVSFKF